MIEEEKDLEIKLRRRIKRIGGIALKMVTMHFTGLPDRLCLLPEGRLFFAEIKTTKKKPRKIQVRVHKILTDLGFKVYVIDNSRIIDQIMKNYE